MASEWPTLSLQQANVELIDCEHRTPPPSDAGYPYVAIPQLRHGRIDLSSVRLISPQHYVEWTRKAKPEEHDVVLSRRCNPGETAFVPENLEFALGQNLVLLRADGTMVYPPFLRWLVSSPEWWEQIGKFLNVGAVFDSLRCADVPKLTLHVPPLEDQRAISHVLGTLDGKIDLNERMNETLDAMAQTLFKSWFVDFDPVRAKAQGRDTGLPDHVAVLFPGSFEESELGEIPKQWPTCRLDDLLVLQRGFDLPKTVRNIGSYPVLAASGPSGTHDKFMQKGPGVTTGRSGVLGNVFYIHENFWPLNTSLWVKEFKHSTPAFAFHLLRHLDLKRFNAGSAVPTLNRNHVHGLRVLMPPMCLIQEFETHAVALLKRQRGNERESGTLGTLRDALLPKLISGEVRVGASVEEACTR
jgi:type I restriction enzyme S subunit